MEETRTKASAGMGNVLPSALRGRFHWPTPDKPSAGGAASMLPPRRGRPSRRGQRLAAWFLAGVAGIVMATMARPAAGAQALTRNVLVLYSSSRLLQANIEADRALRAEVRTSEEHPVEIYDEFLDATRFSGKGYGDLTAAYLREKYVARPPEVIVAGGEQALRFVLDHRAVLFAQTPVVHMGVAKAALQSLPPLPSDVVGVPVEYDILRTIDQALRWHPKTRQLVIVTGNSNWDRVWESRLRKDAGTIADRVRTEFLAGLPTDTLLNRLRTLPKDTVVFTPGYFQDGSGRNCTPLESVREMAAVSSAPIYGPFNTFIGSGIVGGFMPSFTAMGQQTAVIVNKLFDGTPPAALLLPEAMPTFLEVDWRQIRRWGIPDSAIPAETAMQFRQLSFWDQYRNELIGAAVVFLLQAALTGWLLFERFRRRRAERDVQRQRFELVHASRLAVAGELTASIAHEINQPLGAILSNTDAAELLLEAGGNRLDELREILADIRRDDLRASEVIRRLRGLLGKHETERQAFDLGEVTSEVKSVLGAEARRRGISLEIRPPVPRVTLMGDRIAIQQVLLNLVLNAMDAVAEGPEDRRVVTISIAQGDDSVVISVRDQGQGIAPEHLPRLFDSFFSTKRTGMGLGLSIAQTLASAHGGRIWADSRWGDGATFHVELPYGSPLNGPTTEQA